MPETQDWFASNAPMPPPTPPPVGNPTMHAPTGNEPVTLGDLKEDPIGSMQRIGSLLKKDATDPKLWMGLAASYFGSKALPFVMPAIARSMSSVGRGVKAVGGVLEPGDIGIVSPRLGRAADLAGRVRGAMQPPASPVPTAQPVAPPAPVESPLGLTQRVRAEYRAANAQPGNAAGGTPPPSGPPVAAVPASAPVPGRPAAASSKANLSAPEVLELAKLRAQGKTEAQAWASLQAQREIRERFGLKIPTKAETRFPKGNRGGPPTDE